MFLGYSKETKGYLFYNHKDNKVFVSTHAKFLEDDYVNNFNPRSKVVLAEIDEPVVEQPMDESRDDVAEGKSGFVSHTKLIAEATFMDLFHS